MSKTYDVIIIGGGIVGSSIAYNLVNDGLDGRVAVMEKDPTYEFATTSRSVGGIRQQFSTEINVRISTYGIEFFEGFDSLMEVGGERAYAQFKQVGYLFLADEASWPHLKGHYELQRRLGADVELLSPHEIKEIIPHLALDGIVGGTFGRRDGYVDPYGVLQGYIRKARSLGVDYIHDEVIGILVRGGRVEGVRTLKGGVYHSRIVVNAAGPYAAHIGRMAGIHLPVEPERRMVYVFDPWEKFSYELPLTIDPSGLYFRHETGRTVLTGRSRDEEAGFNFQWDKDFFQDTIWPTLARLVPSFNTLKLIRGWAGLYAINRLDHNAIVGDSPQPKGFYMAVGFSGHGLQQAPAVGKCLSELIRLGHYETLDLTPLGYERILQGQPLQEDKVV